VYLLVPGTKYFRAPSTMFFLAALAVAALTGEGVENVLRGRVGLVYPIAWAAGALLLAGLAAGGALTTVSLGLAGPDGADLVVDNASAVTAGALRCLAFVVLTGLVLMLRYRKRLPPRAAAWTLALLLAADLWSVEHLYWRFSPPASVVFASDAAIDYVRSQPQPARVLALGVGSSAAARDPELFGDALMIHRVRSALGYHSNEIARYDVLTGKAEGFRPIFSSQLWRLLNIRFLLCDLASLPVPGSQLVVGPVRDAAGSTVYLYRLPGDNPAAWVAPVSVKAGDDQALATVRDPRFDPTVAAVYDTAAPVPGRVVEKLPTPLGISVSSLRYDPGHMTFHLDRPAPAGASLIVSENFYPGWTATADGAPAVTARADYTLIGVPLPAGASTVDLVFRSRIFTIGAFVTLGAGLAAALWWVATVFTGARPRDV
jgi:hypothetical protein